jgi:hypothetical protein
MRKAPGVQAPDEMSEAGKVDASRQAGTRPGNASRPARTFFVTKILSSKQVFQEHKTAVRPAKLRFRKHSAVRSELVSASCAMTVGARTSESTGWEEWLIETKATY